MSQARPRGFITDFFKPFAQPRLRKRPHLDDSILRQTSVPPSEPNTPVTKSRTRQLRPEPAITDHRRSSSQSSSTSRVDHLSETSARPEDDALCGMDTASVDSPPWDIEHGQSPEFMPRSSQRVIRQGKVVITNSDVETDSEGSLDDIDELLALRKPPLESSPPSETKLQYTTPRKLKDNDHRSSTQRKTRSSAAAKPSRLATEFPAMAKYKFSMDSLIAQTREDDVLEAAAAKAREALEDLEQRGNTSSAMENPNTNTRDINVQTKVIALAMRDRDDENERADRLMSAIRRTEAFHIDPSWSFFDGEEKAAEFEPTRFPPDNYYTWPRSMKDPLFRQQAFLGGYAGEVALKKELPEEIFMWITDSSQFFLAQCRGFADLWQTVCTEPRYNLRHSYCQLLKDTAGQVKHLLTPTCIDGLFRKLGAGDDALKIERPVVPRLHQRQSEEVRESSRLHVILDLLGGCAEHLNADARTHAICLLCRLVLDSSITNDCSLMVAIEEAFHNLVDAVPEENAEAELLVVLTIVYRFVTDVSLRLQLLRNIPASSARLNMFRRRLALAYLFGNPTYLQKRQEDLVNLRSIAHHLRKPQFEIDNGTDYATLAALIGILSIGVGDGDPPLPSSGNSAEADFNKDVDMLSQRVKSMFTSITDTGASHMRRTEAKEVLESFHSCLLHAVRTMRKPKTMLFGDVDLNFGSESKSALWLKSHLEKAKSGTVPTSGVKSFVM